MTAADKQSPLKGLKVASPCHVEWDSMTGDERSRHCDSCQLSVFNISDMTRRQAEEFLSASAGRERTCVRFYQRTDGTVLTDDCPVGLRRARALARAARQRIFAAASLVVSLISTFLPLPSFAQKAKPATGSEVGVPPVIMGEMVEERPAQVPQSQGSMQGKVMPGKQPKKQPVEVLGQVVIQGPDPMVTAGAKPKTPAPIPVLGKLAPFTGVNRPDGGAPSYPNDYGWYKIKNYSEPELIVSCKIVAPEGTWLEEHKTITKSAVWSLKSASLNWQINAGMLESSRLKFHDAAEHAFQEKRYFEAVLSVSNEANCLYYQGKGEEACARYEHALRLLEQPEFKNKPALQQCIASNLAFATKMHRENAPEQDLAARRELLPYIGDGHGATIGWLLDDIGNQETTVALKD